MDFSATDSKNEYLYIPLSLRKLRKEHKKIDSKPSCNTIITDNNVIDLTSVLGFVPLFTRKNMNNTVVNEVVSLLDDDDTPLSKPRAEKRKKSGTPKKRSRKSAPNVSLSLSDDSIIQIDEDERKFMETNQCCLNVEPRGRGKRKAGRARSSNNKRYSKKPRGAVSSRRDKRSSGNYDLNSDSDMFPDGNISSDIRNKLHKGGRGSVNQPQQSRSRVKRVASRPQRATTRRKQRGARRSDSPDDNIPTYSVGNTHEYQDNSENVPLFSNQHIPKPTPTLEEFPVDNEEVTVKVCWQSYKVHKFTFRKYEKLTKMFDFFKKESGADYDNLLFMLNDNIVQPHDTPHSIGYRITRIIQGGVHDDSYKTENSLTTQLTDSLLTKECPLSKKDKDSIELKFQRQGVRKPDVFTISKDEMLSLTMIKYAEQLDLEPQSLMFKFDGESIFGNMTPRDMDLENGDSIDVIELKK